VGLSDEDVREILRIIDESELAELQIQTEGFSLHVVRGRTDADSQAAESNAAREPAPARDVDAPVAPRETAPRLGKAPAPGDREADGLLTIESPMLGTFYRAEGPGAEPFVQPGSRLEPDTIVCIIEVMKMMNSVPAGVSGELVEVCSQNAALVEYGQPLFRVRPR
jgi:acetyl-CoA carboxylase biotin carboxyl carrier protein